MNTFNKIPQILLLPILLLSLIGCAVPNIPEPSKPEDTLLIGQMILESEGWNNAQMSSVNGEQKAKIQINFQNCDNQKTYRISTDRNGLFYILNPNPGIYLIARLYIEVKSDNGSWVSLRSKPHFPPANITINSGQVVNLGSLLWIADKTDSIYRLDQVKGSTEDLQAIFTEKFPNSLWLKRDWVNLSLHPL